MPFNPTTLTTHLSPILQESVSWPSGTQVVLKLTGVNKVTAYSPVIPISEHQDTVGPMTRSVTDAVIILSVIAGRDARDNFTLAQPYDVPDYTAALNADGLRGKRLGVPRKFLNGLDSVIVAAFNASLETMKGRGATIIDPADFPDFDDFAATHESIVLSTEFKVGVNRYISELQEVPTGVKNLADLIAFNTAHADKDLVPPFWTDQSQFITSENTTVDQAFLDAVTADKDLGATRGIDATLQAFNLDALLLPTDVSSTPAAITGYPIITVPLGFLPPDTTLAPAQPTRSRGPNQLFGLSFLGTAFSEFGLVSLVFAYEQATYTRLLMLAYPEAIPKTQLADIVEVK